MEITDIISLFESDEVSDTEDSGLHKIPIYISIDKDILSPDVVRTNWDQGIMSLEELFGILKTVFSACDVRGVDICGAPGPDASNDDIRRDDEVNREMISCLEKCFRV